MEFDINVTLIDIVYNILEKAARKRNISTEKLIGLILSEWALRHEYRESKIDP